MLALICEMGGFGRLGWRVAATIVKGVNGEVFWAKGVWDEVVWTNGGEVVTGLVCGMEISTWVEAGMFGSVGSYGLGGGSSCDIYEG